MNINHTLTNRRHLQQHQCIRGLVQKQIHPNKAKQTQKNRKIAPDKHRGKIDKYIEPTGKHICIIRPRRFFSPYIRKYTGIIHNRGMTHSMQVGMVTRRNYNRSQEGFTPVIIIDICNKT